MIYIYTIHIYIYIYTHIHVFSCTYICIYIYRERDIYVARFKGHEDRERHLCQEDGAGQEVWPAR